MSLEKELNLVQAITPTAREVMLNIYYTASCIKKRADEFFRRFGLSDVQFNVLMLLAHQKGSAVGLTQAQLSNMMLVNRANVTALIDRMEKTNLVIRTADPADRRSNIIELTTKGKKLLDKVEPLYLKEIKKTTVLNPTEQKKLIKLLEKIRKNLNE